MMNYYIESYLIDRQIDLFVTAVKKGYEIIDFINKFMKSNLAMCIDDTYSNYHMMSAKDWLFYLLKEYKELKPTNIYDDVNLSAVMWLATFYRKWHFITGESSKTIVRFLNPKKGLQSYYIAHQHEENESIEQFKMEYNLKRNSHRKYEGNKVISKVNYSNLKNKYYPFIAKKVLFKLLKDKRLDSLKFSYDINYYPLINDDKTIGIYCRAINKDNLSIKDGYESDNDRISYFKINPKISIYFCFIFNKENINEIEEYLKKNINLINTRFDYIYFFSFNRLFECKKDGSVIVYDLPISKSIINMSIKECKSYISS